MDTGGNALSVILHHYFMIRLMDKIAVSIRRLVIQLVRTLLHGGFIVLIFLLAVFKVSVLIQALAQDVFRVITCYHSRETSQATHMASVF